MTWLDGQIRWPSSRGREWPKQTHSRLGHSVTQRHSVHVSSNIQRRSRFVLEDSSRACRNINIKIKQKSVSDQQVTGEVIYKPPFWDSTVGNHFTTYHEHICQHICQHIYQHICEHICQHIYQHICEHICQHIPNTYRYNLNTYPRYILPDFAGFRPATLLLTPTPSIHFGQSEPQTPPLPLQSIRTPYPDCQPSTIVTVKNLSVTVGEPEEYDWTDPGGPEQPPLMKYGLDGHLLIKVILETICMYSSMYSSYVLLLCGHYMLSVMTRIYKFR